MRGSAFFIGTGAEYGFMENCYASFIKLIAGNMKLMLL